MFPLFMGGILPYLPEAIVVLFVFGMLVMSVISVSDDLLHYVTSP